MGKGVGEVWKVRGLGWEKEGGDMEKLLDYRKVEGQKVNGQY